LKKIEEFARKNDISTFNACYARTIGDAKDPSKSGQMWVKLTRILDRFQLYNALCVT
jgi:hypothetical protein